MTLAEKWIRFMKVLQTGAIGGFVALPWIYRACGFHRSSMYYQDGERLLNAGVIVGFLALATSVILILLPKAFGVRKRGWYGGALSLAMFLINGLLMPLVLPDSPTAAIQPRMEEAEQGEAQQPPLAALSATSPVI